MRPPDYKNPHFVSKRKIGDLSKQLEALLSLVENTLAHLDPADAKSLAVLRQRFDTTRREFQTRRLEAEEAQRRMRAYVDRSTNAPLEDTVRSCTHGEVAVAESQDYAQDAILVAVIASEEAELATLEAILNKVELEVDQSTSNE